MRRSSKYHPLQWALEARWPGSPVWETIAAFNSDEVAKGYADDYAKKAQPINGKPWGYRVVERNSRGLWAVIHDTSKENDHAR